MRLILTAAAIAALLPQRADVPSAVRDAHRWLANAIANADRLSVASTPDTSNSTRGSLESKLNRLCALTPDSNS